MKKLFSCILSVLLTISLLTITACKKEEPYDPKEDRALIESYEFTVSSGDQTVTPMRFYCNSSLKDPNGFYVQADGFGFGVLYNQQNDQLRLIPALKLDGALTVSHDPNFTVKDIILFNPNGSYDEAVYQVGFEELSLLNDGYYYVAFQATAKTEIYEQTDHLVFKLIVENGEYQGSYFALRSGKNSVIPRKYFSWSEDGQFSADGSGYHELYREPEEVLLSLPALKLDGPITANHAGNVTVHEIVKIIDPTDPDTIPRQKQFEELSTLQNGSYVVVVRTKTSYDTYSVGYDHVFKLIVEKVPD